MTITEIAKKIENVGGNLYLVGGAIRNKILGRPIKDEDYCVTGLLDEEFIKIFPNAREQGKFFGVFALEGNEFAMARTEEKRDLGHKGFSIETNKKITIEEDLKRRDITINAIAQNVLTGKIVDPYNGIQDIKNKKIRAVSKAFCEDPLRVYRVARFSAELGFEVEENTLKMMKSLREELETLSAERVFEELKKALKSDKPSVFFEVLKKANVLDVHFKEIYDLIGAVQPVQYHPEGDAYNHTMITLDNAAKITQDEKIRFACLVHDLGKGRTPKEMYPHHHGHEEMGIEPLKELSRRIKIPNVWKDYGMTAIREHMRGGIFNKMTIPKKVTFLERIGKSKLGLDGLQKVVYSDRARHGEKNIENSEYNFANLGKKMIEEINGEYLRKKNPNIQPGRKFGNELHKERIKWMKEELE